MPGNFIGCITQLSKQYFGVSAAILIVVDLDIEKR